MATILIIIGVLTGALGLLDTFLSQDQKAKIDRLVLKAWMWLDDAKRISLVGWLLRADFRRWFLAMASAITVVGAAFTVLRDSTELDEATVVVLLMMIAGLVIGGLMGQAILRHILRKTPLTAPLWAIFYMVLIPIVAMLITYGGPLKMAGSILESITRGAEPRLGDLEAFFVFVFTTCVVVIFTLIATLPVVIVASLQGTLFVAEAVVRRIAESPKGVVIAVSGIATAGGSILKAFA